MKMTIFMTVVKSTALDRLKKLKETAEARDHGLFTLWKNATLTKKVKELISALEKQIREFSPSGVNEQDINKLSEIILNTRNAILQIGDDTIIQDLTQIAEGLNKFSDTARLLLDEIANIEKNEWDPFHVFCEKALHYFFEYTISPLSASASVDKVRIQKEACLLGHLRLCKEKINTVVGSSKHKELIIEEIVIKEAEAVKKENAEICKKSQLGLSFFAKTQLMPSLGRLEVHMQQVIETLSNKSDNSLRSESFSNENSSHPFGFLLV